MNANTRLTNELYDRNMLIDAICGTELDERTSQLMLRHLYRKLMGFGDRHEWDREFLNKKSFNELKLLYLRLRTGFFLRGE